MADQGWAEALLHAGAQHLHVDLIVGQLEGKKSWPGKYNTRLIITTPNGGSETARIDEP
jgi:hypothetical protein